MFILQLGVLQVCPFIEANLTQAEQDTDGKSQKTSR